MPTSGVADSKAAWTARYILMERFAEDAALLAKVRIQENAHRLHRRQRWKKRKVLNSATTSITMNRIATVPSHRALAMFRGRNVKASCSSL